MSKAMNPPLCVQTSRQSSPLSTPSRPKWGPGTFSPRKTTSSKDDTRENARLFIHCMKYETGRVCPHVSSQKILNEFQWNLVLAVCNKTCGSAHNGPIHDVQNKLNNQYIHNTYYGNLKKLRLWLIVVHSIHCQYHIIPYLTNLLCIYTELYRLAHQCKYNFLKKFLFSLSLRLIPSYT